MTDSYEALEEGADPVGCPFCDGSGDDLYHDVAACTLCGGTGELNYHRLIDMAIELDRLRLLRREWPERNQVEGLSRALAALQSLRTYLSLTAIGPCTGYQAGSEPSYESVLRHHLDAIEVMIGPDFTRAQHVLKWAKS